MPWADPNHDFTWTREEEWEFRQKQAGKWMWVDASDSRVIAHIIHQNRLHGWKPREMPQGEVAAFVHPNRYISMLDLGATELPQQQDIPLTPQGKTSGGWHDQQEGAPIPDGDELDQETAKDIDTQLELHLNNNGVEYGPLH